jgi:hypothetical protein
LHEILRCAGLASTQAIAGGKAGCTLKHIIGQNSTKIIGALHLKIEPQSGDNICRKIK